MFQERIWFIDFILKSVMSVEVKCIFKKDTMPSSLVPCSVINRTVVTKDNCVCNSTVSRRKMSRLQYKNSLFPDTKAYCY